MSVRASGHALGTDRIVSCDDGSAVGRRERCQRRPYPRQARVAMNVRKQRLHAWYEWLAVKELANSHGRIKRFGVAFTPCSRAQVGVEICGRRNAAGEISLTRLKESRFCGGEYRKIP